jgi:hypothetical protein
MDMDSLQFGSASSTYPPFSFSPGLSLDVDYLDFMTLDSQKDVSTALCLHSSTMGAADSGHPSMNTFMGMVDVSTDPNSHLNDRGSTIDRPSTPASEDTLTAYKKITPTICVSVS